MYSQYSYQIQQGRRVCMGDSYYRSYRSPKSVRAFRKKRMVRRRITALTAVLALSFTAFFLTARPAEARKQDVTRYKYYTGMEVDRGDTLWTIAEERLKDKDTAAEYRSIRVYIDEIMTINGLYDRPVLEAGQYIIVPYYSTEFKE